MVGGTASRIYYDGRRELEERDAGDVRSSRGRGRRGWSGGDGRTDHPSPQDAGLGDAAGYALVLRGTDVALSNAAGLWTGTVEPTAQYLLVERLAGADAAALSEVAVDLATLPAGLNALPVRGPAPVFTSTADFVSTAPRTAGAGISVLLDRAGAQSQRILRAVVGEQEGYILGSGVSPGPLGPGSPITISRGVTDPLIVLDRLEAAEAAGLGTRSAAYFEERILGDLSRYGTLRGRLGNSITRIATLNELLLIEERGARPVLEFSNSASLTQANRIAPDIAVVSNGQPTEILQLLRASKLKAEVRKARLVRQAYPGVPIHFVIVRE